MNNTTLIVLLGFYTLLLIGGIYYYEDKYSRLDKDYKDLEHEFFEVYTAYTRILEQSDIYQDAYNLEHSAIHHQMEINEELNANNDDLREIISQLDKDNLALESQLKHLKGEIAAYRNVQPKQYEYSAWSQSTWAGDAEVSNTTYTIDTNPYKEDIIYIQDHLDFEQ